MLEHNQKKSVRLVVSRNRLRIEADLSVDWRRAGIYSLIVACVLLLVASTLSEGVRNILIEILLNLLQVQVVWKIRVP